ncbi:hypothetical protein VNO78_23855 [Psophocarpus tetragonolobus]|uniref:Uncharacterized protein n=1 Tax=Psophocarpus tetragonolobus TaxID=3891 RepID=A0AAN9XES4_PSOTE
MMIDSNLNFLSKSRLVAINEDMAFGQKGVEGGLRGGESKAGEVGLEANGLEGEGVNVVLIVVLTRVRVMRRIMESKECIQR